MKEYLLYKQKINEYSLNELLEELEEQVESKTVFKYVNNHENKVKECDKKIFLIKIRILEMKFSE